MLHLPINVIIFIVVHVLLIQIVHTLPLLAQQLESTIVVNIDVDLVLVVVMAATGTRVRRTPVIVTVVRLVLLLRIPLAAHTHLVRAHVPMHVPIGGEGQVAVFARERTLPAVDQNVTVQRRGG